MPLRKGQASEAFKQGKMEKYNFKNLSKEKKREIALKGVEARREKSKAKKAMKEQLEMLLSLDVTSPKSKKRMQELGIEKDDMTNQMLLMVSLFQKALTGDVSAIKQINDMINNTQNDENTRQPTVINIVGVKPSKITTSDSDEEYEYDDEDDDW